MRDQQARRRIAILENQILDLQEIITSMVISNNTIINSSNGSMRFCTTCGLTNVVDCSEGVDCPHGFDMDEVIT